MTDSQAIERYVEPGSLETAGFKAYKMFTTDLASINANGRAVIMPLIASLGTSILVSTTGAIPLATFAGMLGLTMAIAHFVPNSASLHLFEKFFLMRKIRRAMKILEYSNGNNALSKLYAKAMTKDILEAFKIHRIYGAKSDKFDFTFAKIETIDAEGMVISFSSEDHPCYAILNMADGCNSIGFYFAQQGRIYVPKKIDPLKKHSLDFSGVNAKSTEIAFNSALTLNNSIEDLGRIVKDYYPDDVPDNTKLQHQFDGTVKDIFKDMRRYNLRPQISEISERINLSIEYPKFVSDDRYMVDLVHKGVMSAKAEMMNSIRERLLNTDDSVKSIES